MDEHISFPPVRNLYYFGKLLTQRDMEAEQDYFNTKRRLCNLAAVGAGILCGLGIVKVNGQSIAIESGVALDGVGRELVLGKPVVMRLDEMGGFRDDRGLSPSAYLCAEYAATPTEPSHAIVDNATADNRYGRVEEGVRFYLRYREPAPQETLCGVLPNESLEQKLERGAGIRICLARVHIIRWEEAYEIDRIEIDPFHQTIGLRQAVAPPVVSAPPAPPVVSAPPQIIHTAVQPPPAPPRLTASGTASVSIPARAKRGEVYLSEKIEHGLGLAAADISVGVRDGKGAIFGAHTIFQPDSGFEWAVQTNTSEGTFQIGVRLLARDLPRILHFTWKATVEQMDDAIERPQLVISPGVLRLALRETAQFTVSAVGVTDPALTWSVIEPDGGSITSDGFYIAPGSDGVFTVCATCPSMPEVCAYAYVVVSKT